MDEPTPVIVDTDTASDDAQALLFATRSPRLDVQAVTVVAGNVAFDDQVANACTTLELAGADDVPVYSGARRPLAKSHDHATAVHGPTGLGSRTANPDRGPADEYAVDEILRRVRERPGEIGVVAIGPLTNLAEALRREPEFPELVGDVWVMGGAIDTRGNVTPAAEFNVWVDPDAARLVFRELETTLIDWGLSLADGTLGPDALARIEDAETALASFFTDVTRPAVELTRERTGERAASQPDAAAVAVAGYPELVTDATEYLIEVDSRDGLTRGHTVAYEPEQASGAVSEATDDSSAAEPSAESSAAEPSAESSAAEQSAESSAAEPTTADDLDSSHARTRVIDAMDGDRFTELLVSLYETGEPTLPE